LHFFLHILQSVTIWTVARWTTMMILAETAYYEIDDNEEL